MNNLNTIDIVYFITDDYWDLTLESIKYLRLFCKAPNNLVITVFYIGKKPVYLNNDIVFIEIQRKIDLPFFIHRPEIYSLMNKKFIFLDSDTIPQTCISKLYNIDLKDNVIASVPCNYMRYYGDSFDFYSPTEELKLNYGDILQSKDELFFNAGVLVIDGKKWNDQKCSESFMEVYNMYNKSWYSYMDEIALNLSLGKSKILELNEKWNYNKNDSDRRYITHYYGKPAKNKPDYYSTLKIKK